jgi:hypothetical protein
VSETAREAAEAQALAVVNDVGLAEQCWEDLPAVLQILTVLRHRELTERLWHVLPDAFRCLVWEDDAHIDAMVRRVIHDYVVELGL